jgi:hypothetical protein|tara:strand:+ start:3770 stop:4039 length:270 start_codon:yes stop_codon:yes gene_type:complete
MTCLTSFTDAIERKSQELFSAEEWAQRKASYEKVGIDIIYYDMQSETYNALYDENPSLFEGFQWINSEDGMPLWVRPGVNWVPDYEYDD